MPWTTAVGHTLKRPWEIITPAIWRTGKLTKDQAHDLCTFIMKQDRAIRALDHTVLNLMQDVKRLTDENEFMLNLINERGEDDA